MGIRVSQALEEATKRLKGVVERPRFEAEILLAHYLNCDRSYLLLKDRDILDDSSRFFELIDRRLKSEPIEYITNRVSFYSKSFYISQGALIPRPETEILVDKSAKIISSSNIKRVAEIGVGSGAISITLAQMFPSLKIIATDISLDALAVARENIRRFALEDRIELRHSSLLEGVGDIDMIVSNPPYISKDFKLESNVVDYEPHTALFASRDGTELLRKIVALAKDRSIPLACEMGFDQREAMQSYFLDLGIENYYFYKDLANLDRGFIIK